MNTEADRSRSKAVPHFQSEATGHRTKDGRRVTKHNEKGGNKKKRKNHRIVDGRFLGSHKRQEFVQSAMSQEARHISTQKKTAGRSCTQRMP